MSDVRSEAVLTFEELVAQMDTHGLPWSVRSRRKHEIINWQGDKKFVATIHDIVSGNGATPQEALLTALKDWYEIYSKQQARELFAEFLKNYKGV